MARSWEGELVDDGSVLQIDDEEAASDDGEHATTMVAGFIPLKHGLHRIRLKYFQASGAAALGVSWGPIGHEPKSLDGSVLFH